MHSSRVPTPSLCVPASRRGSRKMTLKASGGDGGGSMRTALSDLYLEHLLQKRSRPEVSGPRGSPGRGVRSQDSAAPLAAGPPPSVALSPGRACPQGSCCQREGRGGQQPVRSFGCGGWLPPAALLVGIRRGRGLDRVLIKVKENFFVDGSQGNRKTLRSRSKSRSDSLVLKCLCLVGRKGCKSHLWL